MSLDLSSAPPKRETEVSSSPPRQKRSWKQFSLRTFFVFVTIVALCFAWLVSTWKYVREQRAAVTSLDKAGVTIMYNYHENGPRSWTTNPPPQPSWLRSFIGPEYFDRPTMLNLVTRRPSLKDDWVGGVNIIGSFKTLLISYSATDKNLESLAASDQIVEIHLNNALITDQGLPQLTKFPNLKWLLLHYTKISDEGIGHLAPLEKLEQLNLTATAVTDESIPVLVKFKFLTRLELDKTLLTEEGANQIKNQLPNCEVSYSKRKAVETKK